MEQQPPEKVIKPRKKAVFRYKRRYFKQNEVGVYKLKNFVTRYKRIMRNQLIDYDRGIGTTERAKKSIIKVVKGKGMGARRRALMNDAVYTALSRQQVVLPPKAPRGYALKKLRLQQQQQ